MKVFIAQFVKGKMYSEIKAVREFLKEVEIKQYGRGCFIIKSPTKEDVQAAQKGLAEVKEIMHSEKFDLIIMDEIFIALFYKLLPIEEVIEIIQNKPRSLELILTGRYAPKEIAAWRKTDLFHFYHLR